MKRTKRIRVVLGLSFAAALAAVPAMAQQPSPQEPPQGQPPHGQPPPVAREGMAQMVSATGTVEKINRDTRQLMIRDEQGNLHTVRVPESVKRFDAIKPGDRISIDYYEAMALSLRKGEPGAPPSAGETTMAEREAGQLPGGLMARRITASVEITKIDRANHTVTVKAPDGHTETIRVTAPSAQAELARLQEGDRIQATYTEAIAVDVTRQGKGSQEQSPPE